MNIPVTVCLPTKDRYEALSNCLLSLAMQTTRPREIIIVDDSDFPKKITEIPNILYILRLLAYYKVDYQVVWGAKKGQHHSHQLVQENAKYDWIFRIDDDCVAEPNVLNYLWTHVENHEVAKKRIGAIAPLVLMPNPVDLPDNIPLNTLLGIDSYPNIQWFLFEGIRYVEHLNSTFLYRKGITKYNLSLSKVAYREETIFTHEIMKAGYNLAVCGDARVWHFRQESGGIRSHPDKSLYDHDEVIFNQLRKSWDQEGLDRKVIVLDNGIGDHYAFMHILDDLLKKHDHVTIAACYPDIFKDYKDKIELISIAEAKLMYGSLDKFNIYMLMDANKHRGTLVEAFKKLYNE